MNSAKRETGMGESNSLHMHTIHRNIRWYIHVHTKLIVDKRGNEYSSVVEQLSGYTVCS